MYIEYTFKINAYSIEKEVISVSYLPTDPTLEPYHVQQLGVARQILVDYAEGTITQAEFQTKMRKAIVDADGMAQQHWNAVLQARQLVVPETVDLMLGAEWSVVTEAESISTESKMGVL